jgi:hypothetical protein
MAKNLFKKHTTQLTARSNISEIRNRLLQLEDTQKTDIIVPGGPVGDYVKRAADQQWYDPSGVLISPEKYPDAVEKLEAAAQKNKNYKSVYDDLSDDDKESAEDLTDKLNFLEALQNLGDLSALSEAEPKDFIYAVNLLADKFTSDKFDPYPVDPDNPAPLNYEYIRKYFPDGAKILNAKLKNIADSKQNFDTDQLLRQLSEWMGLRAHYILEGVDVKGDEDDAEEEAGKKQYRADVASGKAFDPATWGSSAEAQAYAQQTANDRDEYRANQNRANNQMIDKTVNDLRNAEMFNTGQQEYLKQQLAQLMGKKF